MTNETTSRWLEVAEGVDESRAVESNQLKRIMGGEVLLLRGNTIAHEMREAVIAETERLFTIRCGAQVGEQVRSLGLTRLHEIADIGDIMAVHEAATRNLQPFFVRKTEQLIREELGLKDFFLNRNFVLRFYVPNDVMRGSYKSLSTRPGKLIQHGPHYDFWQNVALNAINIWMAVDKVTEENGMIVFPQSFGIFHPRGKEHIADHVAPGEPVRIACEPSDIVFFHSQHLHGGILNRSAMTRAVITTRFTVARPAHPRMGAQLRYASAASVRSGRKFAIWLSERLDSLRPVNLVKRAEKALSRGRPGSEDLRIKLLDSVLPHAPPASPLGNTAAPGHGAAAGEKDIRIVDEKTIEVRVDGTWHRLKRRCPHQGAYLACGHVKSGRIHCPWHDQPFDARTGLPLGECSGLRSIGIEQPHVASK